MTLILKLSIDLLSPTSPGLNYSVRDHTGKDVTSFFQTMLYVEPPKNASNNLNDRQVVSIRPINTCGEMEGIFVNSTCDREDALFNSIEGSMGAYTYNCLAWVRHPNDSRVHRRLILPFHGECEEDEICVNGVGENELRMHQPVGVAQCVKRTAYVKESTTSNTELAQHLSRWNVDVSLSATNQQTPLKAETIHTEAGSSAQAGAKGSTQTKSCVNCVDLMTGQLGPNTDFLDTEVQLLDVGIFAGILWLTVLSG